MMQRMLQYFKWMISFNLYERDSIIKGAFNIINPLGLLNLSTR